MSEPAAIGLLVAIGLAVGSFLNVCIYRLPHGLSLLSPASHCPRCHRPVRWHDNVPVVGYLLLRGRCRDCGERISWRYPVVEIVTPLLFLVSYWHLGWQGLLASRLVFACAMLVLFVIDLDHRILPNVITLPGIVVGLAFSVVLPPGWPGALAGILLGGAIPIALIWAWERLRGVEAMGFGDVKMLAMIGAFLGWKLMLLTLVLASFVGSLAGALLIATRRGSLKYELPFGTFLALAAVFAGLYGEAIVEWYSQFYR